MPRRHLLSAELDERLLFYAGRSWNAYEATFAIQQMAGLAAAYEEGLCQIYGPHGLGDARRVWGTVADLCGAITGLPPTLQTLNELGMNVSGRIEHVTLPPHDYAFARNRILDRLDLRAAKLGDVGPMLKQAVEHDRVAKPLLEELRDEMRSLDLEVLSIVGGEKTAESLGDLMRILPDRPEDFPLWDGRPMFLQEQRAFFDYLTCHARAELVADHLVDEQLGTYILGAARLLRRSEVTSNLVLDHERVPHRLLGRPVGVVAHQVGNAIIDALAGLSEGVDLLDKLYMAEFAVLGEMDLDISPAFSTTRAMITEREIRAFTGEVVDITDRAVLRGEAEAVSYDFPSFDEK